LVVVATRRERIVIPGWITIPGAELYARLLSRAVAAHTRIREATRDDDPWPRYTDVPAPVRGIHQDLVNENRDSGFLLFAGPLRKPSRARSILWYVVWSLVVCAIGLALTAMKRTEWQSYVAVAMGGVSFVLGMVLLIRPRMSKQREWFLLHRNGIGMIGEMSGELSWDELDTARLRGRRSGLSFERSSATTEGLVLTLRTKDGTAIPIPDQYDAPICVVGELVQQYLDAHAADQCSAS
jgi:hypothetical protein